MIAKLEWTQCNAQQITEPLQNPTMGVTIIQQINNNRTNTLERTAAKSILGGGGLNASHLYQIFALDSAVVEAQKC